MSSTIEKPNVIDAAGEGSSSTSGAGVLTTRDNAPASTTEPAQEQERRSTLHWLLKFPLVAILSFSISSLGYSFINEFTRGELATVMSTVDTSRDMWIMVGWRITELGIGWIANFDSMDLAALNFLSHSPVVSSLDQSFSLFLRLFTHGCYLPGTNLCGLPRTQYYLMTAFYNINPNTALAGLAVDVAASFVPFALLRSLSKAHKADASIPNRELIVDKPILVLSSLLGSVVYTVTLVLSYQAYLRPALVLYFEGIHTVAPSGDSLAVLAALALVAGVAARSFVFTPLAATGWTAEDERHAQFDAVSAGLKETFWWNVWGYTTQTKVGIVRTLAVVAVTAVNTYLQCALTISGVDGQGAVAYASAWALASFLAGVGLGFVGEA